MAIANLEKKRIHCKVLCLGAPLSGKKSFLSALSKHFDDRLIEKEEPQESHNSLNHSDFYFLPLNLGSIESYQLKIHFYMFSKASCPTLQNILFNGVDGCIFLVDSCVEKVAENFLFVQECKDKIAKRYGDLENFPQVYYYNKRDRSDVFPVGILQQQFNPSSCSYFEGVAEQSLAVFDSFLDLSKQIIAKMSKLRDEV